MEREAMGLVLLISHSLTLVHNLDFLNKTWNNFHLIQVDSSDRPETIWKMTAKTRQTINWTRRAISKLLHRIITNFEFDDIFLGRKFYNQFIIFRLPNSKFNSLTNYVFMVIVSIMATLVFLSVIFIIDLIFVQQRDRITNIKMKLIWYQIDNTQMPFMNADNHQSIHNTQF